MCVDAGEPGADAELATWLDERPENERALQRVELAVALGTAARGRSRERAARRGGAAAGALGRADEPWGRGLAWSGALAAMLLVAVLLAARCRAAVRAPSSRRCVPRSAWPVNAPSDPVAVLPIGVVVDASAVAVLPFVAAGDATLAQGLERDVVASLRTVPGLYVIADNAVQPYASTELDAAEIGGLLGRAGIVDAAVDLADGRVRVSRAPARRRDRRNVVGGPTSIEPVDELSAIRYEIAESVAATMLDSSLREQVARDGPIERACLPRANRFRNDVPRRSLTCNPIDFPRLFRSARADFRDRPRRGRPQAQQGQPVSKAARWRRDRAPAPRVGASAAATRGSRCLSSLAHRRRVGPEGQPRVADRRARAAAERVERASGKQFLVDGRLGPRIYLGGVEPNDVTYPVLLAILRTNGFAAFESEGRVNIVPDAEFASTRPVMQTDDASIPADDYVTRIMKTVNVNSPRSCARSCGRCCLSRRTWRRTRTATSSSSWTATRTFNESPRSFARSTSCGADADANTPTRTSMMRGRV